MSNTVTCYVRLASGKSKKFKSKDGKGFLGPNNVSYEPPNSENFEVLTLEHWFLGTRYYAFYTEGQKQPQPLSAKGRWKNTNTNEDKQMLIDVTRQALLEAMHVDTKLNVGLGGIVGLFILIIIHMMTG